MIVGAECHDEDAVVGQDVRSEVNMLDMTGGMGSGHEMAGTAHEYKVVSVRTAGEAPEQVARLAERMLNEFEVDGWVLDTVQPVVYNSSTTGYLLLILQR